MDEVEINKKWDIHNIIQEAIRTSHSEPAPETRERLAALETSQKLFMEENKKEHGDLKKSMEDFHTMMFSNMKDLNDKLDKALDKKAGIWVEKVLIWLGVGIGGGLLAYLGNLIIKLINLK